MGCGGSVVSIRRSLRRLACGSVSPVEVPLVGMDCGRGLRGLVTSSSSGVRRRLTSLHWWSGWGPPRPPPVAPGPCVYRLGGVLLYVQIRTLSGGGHISVLTENIYDDSLFTSSRPSLYFFRDLGRRSPSFLFYKNKSITFSSLSSQSDP